MKVILQKPVDKLGVPGDVVDVADGYARNYLIPAGHGGQGQQEHGQARRQPPSGPRAAPLRAEGRVRSPWHRKVISGGPIRVAARAGEEGKLFGSVTAEHIAAAIAAQADVDIDRKDVQLDEPIRSIGTHEVKVHLFTEVEPIITVEVEPEG